MNLEVGKQYPVKVVKILPVGAVVELEDKTTELVHISNVANCYVADIADFVSVGQEYLATCEEGTTRPVQLSFKPLQLKSKKHYFRSEAASAKIANCDKSGDLDSMIAAANSSYEEKNRRYNKRNQRR